MQFIQHWQKLWYRLWSARINLLCAMLMFADFVFGLIVRERPPIWMALLLGLLNLAAVWARFVYQPKAHAKAAEAVRQESQIGDLDNGH